MFTTQMLVLTRTKNDDSKEANMLTKIKVLTISNDPELRRFLEQELNDGKYEIANTQDIGLRLRKTIDMEKPEFIILDIMMPTLDGIEVCLRLRQWTKLPIMMLTKWGTEEGMVRGLNLSSDSYLTEPFGISTLNMRIEETLKRNAAAVTDPLTNIYNETP
jgi:DNA-binding response OmpR family regulator